MDGDQALEDDGPCRVPQPVLQGPEDLAHPGLSGMCRYEDVFDVLRLRGRGLQSKTVSAFLVRQLSSNVPAMIACYHVAIASGRGCLVYMGPRTLILVAPLTDFSNELAMLVGRFSSMRIGVLQLSRGFRRAGADGW